MRTTVSQDISALRDRLDIIGERVAELIADGMAAGVIQCPCCKAGKLHGKLHFQCLSDTQFTVWCSTPGCTDPVKEPGQCERQS